MNKKQINTVLLVTVAQLTSAASLSLETAPPVVVKTASVAGASDVDPDLTEIRRSVSADF
jgi:hypothetical protein